MNLEEGININTCPAKHMRERRRTKDVLGSDEDLRSVFDLLEVRQEASVDGLLASPGAAGVGNGALRYNFRLMKDIERGI